MSALAGARVLLVGNYPPPHGGIAVHLQALHRRLEAQDAWVRVVAVGARRPPPGVLAAGSGAELVAQLAAHGALGFLVHAQISGHTPKGWAIAAAVAALRRPFAPAPVLTLHSGLVPAYFALGEQRRRLARLVCSGFGRVLAVNPLIERALREAGCSPERLRVAPAGCGPLRAGPPPAALAALREKCAPLLACAMAPSPIYGARRLLAALPLLASRMPRVGLALFGPGAGAGLREMARRHRVEERVVVLGELEHPAALGLLGACDVFVRPTLADGDALSVREALGLGKPVVATDVGFRPAGVLLVRSGDPLELARAIERAWSEGAIGAAAPGDELAPVLAAYGELLGRDGPSAAKES